MAPFTSSIGKQPEKMQINRYVEEVLSENALELLNLLAAYAVAASPAHAAGLCHLPVEPENWNVTMMLMHEIFEAEIHIAGEQDWLCFRLLQSFGVDGGQLAYQFTPTFARTLSG